MGNVGMTLKRFFTNKNTVTLLAIIVCVILLYICYNWRVNKAVSTVNACVATKTIAPRVQITEDMVTTTRVLTDQVNTQGTVITDCDQIIGKYSSYASQIPQGSLFYKDSIMKEEEMPDEAFKDIPDNYTIYNLAVDFDSTYGNSIFPGNYIDLYIKTVDPNDLLIYGKFIQHIKVSGVKDSEGRNVFETTAEQRQPSRLLFAVPDDLYLLLKKAEYLGLEIVIVPRNSTYSAKKGETEVSSQYLKDLVTQQTANIPDECVKSETGVATCQADDTQEESTSEESNTVR
jgi:hypothetical protein